MRTLLRLVGGLALGGVAVGVLAAYAAPQFAVALQAGAWLCGGVR